MTVRIGTVFVAAALLIGACGGKDNNPQNEPVPQATGAGGAGAPAAKGGESAPATAAVGGAATGGALAAATTPAPNAKVEIVEFSDFQCPFCGKVEPTLKDLRTKYGDALKVTFLESPLPFHQDAMPSAIAAEAARKQGKFWEMHDKMFSNQQALKPADHERIAGEIGLNVDQFKKDLAAPDVAATIAQHQAIAAAVGASGTPSFFINGKNLRGAQPIEKFQEIIDAEVAEADKASQKGDAWLQSRLKANNPQLFDFVYGGKVPPKPTEQKPPVDPTVYKVDIDPKNDPIKGDVNAPITMVLFSDFQCPFCKKLEPTIAQLMTDYAGKIRLVWKNNPLPFHKDALPAAHAALCAQQQGKFWEMHDKLFDNQQALQPSDFENYAGQIGIDLAKFKDCFAKSDDTFKDRLAADQDEAGKVTARGTPNTFINGRKITGAKDIQEFKDIIDAEMTKAQALLAKGITADKLYEETIKDGKVFEPLEAQVNEFKFGPLTQTMGKKDAKIQVVEFSDFQCPFCSRVAQPLHDLKAKYGDDISITYKMFPLSFHQQAMPAAIGGMCAAEQNKFWEWHDETFAQQKELSDDKLKEIAGKIGLDVAKWDACRQANKYKDQIEADMAEGRNAGVRGTPTLFINGRKFNSPSGYNVDAFTAVIDKYILNKK